ncbi:MAG: InlB B-repeat-containing protein [Methanocorpusculum sp.]|nr:InlB B-repeat-containing protein [Methanocorpusculum sp.]
MRLRKYGTECPKNDAAKLLRRGVVLLAALLLVCTLMAGAVSADGVAKIGETEYATLQWAVDNVTDNTQKTIILLRDAEGDGVKVQSGKKIIFDLAGHTYTVSGKTVGSSGTETNCFQLLNDSDLTFKNGVLKATSPSARIFLQNYANLTLDHVTVQGADDTDYVSSNNYGNVVYKNGTQLLAASGKVAFDVWYYLSSTYANGVSVTIEDPSVIIQGTVEYGCDNKAGDNAKYFPERAILRIHDRHPLSIPTISTGNNVKDKTPANFCWGADSTEGMKKLVPCDPVEPEAPVAEPTKNDDGSVTITSAGTDPITVDTTAKTAITKNESSGITMTIAFSDIASSEDNSVTGNVTKVEVAYKEVPAAAPAAAAVPVPGSVSFVLNLTLENVTTQLPTINATFKNDVAEKVRTAQPGYHPVAMITAETNVAAINANITTSGNGIKIVFTVPKAWVDSMGGPNGGRIWSFHDHADRVDLRQISSRNIVPNGDFYEITVYGTSFSSHGIVGKEASAPQPPQPVYSSGDGNMNNAFRVLFETQGGSYVSPATGLSYGDRVAEPANPVKDGYTFGGWYKDAACTQAWSFSDSIPGDMTLYAKWTSSGTAATATQTAQTTAKATTAPAATQAQSGTTATTAAPVATTAAGAQPTLTQAPAPVLGGLLGLLAAGILLRRKN